jgi:diadenosine tetraphosphate (Ap4A) HIT family hydrolase
MGTSQKEKLPKPLKGAIFYEDNEVYACLANFPIAPGHCVVVWKDDVEDIHFLKHEDYEHLMDIVGKVRNSLLKVMNTDKVYLLYMDEIDHVHWHLVPRKGNEEGFTMFEHRPKELKDTSLSQKLRELI